MNSQGRFSLPAAPSQGWKAILSATFSGIGNDHLSLLAAAIAFYMLFAIFPALAAATSIFGLLADPNTLNQQLEQLRSILPNEAWTIIHNQLTGLVSRGSGSLSLATIVSLVIALYSARLAASSMMESLNLVYKLEETRGFLKTNAIALAFTAVAIVVALLAIALVIVAPIIFSVIGLSGIAGTFIGYLRWPFLFVLVALGLAITYRYGPDREHANWRWVTWGSISATILWLIASLGFSWYVAAFNSYDRVYGSIGAVVILLFWFWLTAFSALLGAELDKQIEDHARKDANR